MKQKQKDQEQILSLLKTILEDVNQGDLKHCLDNRQKFGNMKVGSGFSVYFLERLKDLLKEYFSKY